MSLVSSVTGPVHRGGPPGHSSTGRRGPGTSIDSDVTRRHMAVDSCTSVLQAHSLDELVALG